MGKQTQQTVRLMAPFSMRCNRCGEYVCELSILHSLLFSIFGLSGRDGIWTDLPDKGKKFNARKETAEGEEYYGIKTFRFYIVSKLPSL